MTASNFQLMLSAAEDLVELKPVVLDDISNSRLSILKVVELLEPFLTNKDETERVKGTTLLAIVLLELPKDLLTNTEVEVLTAFFIDRLKDHVIVVPSALTGLVAMTAMKNLPDKAPVDIIVALGQEVTCQALDHRTRHNFYMILHNLMNSKKHELLKNPGDFIYSAISAMDSEADPRNLSLLFSFLPNLYSNFQLAHLTEEAFTMLERYFPVDYTSKPNDPITRDDLSIGLEQTLLSTSEFGPFVIPMLLEKLGSVLKINGLEIWSIDDLDPHIKDMWISLKDLIFTCPDQEVSDAAIRALNLTIYKYSKSSLSPGQALTFKNLLDDVFKGSYRFLKDPSLNLFLPAMKLITAVSQSSTQGCQHVIKSTIPHLSALLNSNADINGQELILSGLATIINASLKFGCWKTEELLPILAPLRDLIMKKIKIIKLQDACFKCLIELLPELDKEMRNQVAESIHSLIPLIDSPNNKSCAMYVKKFGNLYPEEVLSMLSELQIKGMRLQGMPRDYFWDFHETLCGDTGPKESIITAPKSDFLPIVRHASTVLLSTYKASIKNIKTGFQAIFQKATHSLFPLVFVSPHKVSLKSQGNNEQTKRKIEVFCWCCEVEVLTKYAIKTLLEFLITDSRLITLSCLKEFCEKADSNVLNRLGTEYSLVEKLVDFFLSSVNASSEELFNVSKILESIVRHISVTEQQKKLTGLLSSIKNDVSSQIHLMLLKGVMLPLQKEVMLCIPNQLISNLISNCLIEDLSLASSIVVASFINKCQDDSELNLILNQFQTQIDEYLKNNDEKNIAIEAYCRVTKSLFLRGHIQCTIWLNKLIEYLDEPDLKIFAANGFKIILTECDELNQKNYFTFRILYKQKIYGIVKKQIIDKVENGSKEVTPALSLALANVLHNVPSILIIEDAPKVIKVLIRSLECGDAQVTAALLEVVSCLLETNENVFLEYTSTFIPGCLKLLCNKSMKVRMTALDCLYLYGKYSESDLLPYRIQVLEEIKPVLDDQKRLVRQKAVKARTRWFLVGSLDDQN